MKDDEPFKDIGAKLEKVELANGKSSLVIGDLFDVFAAAGETADKIVEVLECKFAKTGVKHGELKKAYVGATGKSESTFNRAWRDLKNTDRVRIERSSGGMLIYPAGVSVNPVSEQCQTPADVSVMSPPLSRG